MRKRFTKHLLVLNIELEPLLKAKFMPGARDRSPAIRRPGFILPLPVFLCALCVGGESLMRLKLT